MTDAQQAMLSILRTHLEEPEMGADDDFYAMGGDSLIALRVVADANEQGMPLELLDLLYHPTVRELMAAIADRGRPGGVSGDLPPGGRFGLLSPWDRALVPPGVETARPASALQLGLIYLCESARDPRLYHDLLGLEVFGSFDERLFAQALADLCGRHGALRSSFDLGGFSEPLQLIWSAVPSPLTITRDLTGDAAARWRKEQLGRPIDWGQAPPFRCHVAVLPASFHVTLATHHSVIDGWSYARLMVDLLLLYEAALVGQPAGLAPLPADGQEKFLALERAAVDSAAAADFWQAEADVPPLLLKRERFAGSANPAEAVGFTIEAELLDQLRHAAAEAGIPLKSLVLGCHAGAIARWTGRDRDVVTGLTASGRPELPGADLLAGLFLNTIPVRFHTTGGGWEQLGRSALAAEQRAQPHRRYPLARIEQRLGRPAFDVSFNYTHFHVYRELSRLRALRAGSWWSFDKASFPVMVDFMIDSRRAGTGVEVAYDPQLITRARAEELAGLFDAALRAAGKHRGRSRGVVSPGHWSA